MSGPAPCGKEYIGGVDMVDEFNRQVDRAIDAAQEENCPHDLAPDRCLTCYEQVGSPFDVFVAHIRDLVEGKAEEKGYNQTGADGPNDLYAFNKKYFAGHSLGEVVYKCVRYASKRNKEDLLKAAAWLYLTWRHDD